MYVVGEYSVGLRLLQNNKALKRVYYNIVLILCLRLLQNNKALKQK